jgi:uncharacterized 2Fe-2S/4Fe-4S cluster protein (DUF4445 family)
MTERSVVFAPSGRRGTFPDGTSLLAAARALGVDLDSVCGGRGICGRCQVIADSGGVTPPGPAEARYTGLRGPLAEGRRLGCQAQLCGDVTADVPPDSQIHRQVIRKSASERPVAVDPVITLHAVQVTEPDMQDPASDGRRLLSALAEQWNLDGLTLGFAVLPTLQAALTTGNFLVTAAVRHGREVVAVFPGVRTRAAGVAIDIGSTTIAAHLCDLHTGEVLASSGRMNPQIRHGEDLMSRVSHAMQGEAAVAELTQAVRGGIAEVIASAAADAQVAVGDLLETVIVGNPVMLQLALGVDPTPLGQAPFALAWDGPLDIPAAALGLAIAPGAHVHALPCIAGHVGADAAAVILAEAPHLSDELMLIADVGTNAEIVLGDRHGILACSSPTGPAFEGAQLTSGQRAAPGAIERIRIDRQTLEPRFKVIGSDLWSDEPGFAEATAATGVTGLCGSGIIEAVGELFLAGVIATDGGLNGALAERTPRIREEHRSFTYMIREAGPRIAITQHDVRAIQLAKAALHAGCKLLMARRGVDAVPQVSLAGAFGSHIDPLYALVLGLIPDCDLQRVSAAGNAAGHGARIALVNRAAREEIAALARRVEKIETALEPSFQTEFVAAMAFPHATDAYGALARVVELPPRTAGQPRRRQAAAWRGST